MMVFVAHVPSILRKIEFVTKNLAPFQNEGCEYVLFIRTKLPKKFIHQVVPMAVWKNNSALPSK